MADRPRSFSGGSSALLKAKFVIKKTVLPPAALVPDSARQLAAAPIPGDAGRAASLRRDIARLETLAAAAEADDAARADAAARRERDAAAAAAAREEAARRDRAAAAERERREAEERERQREADAIRAVADAADAEQRRQQLERDASFARRLADERRASSTPVQPPPYGDPAPPYGGGAPRPPYGAPPYGAPPPGPYAYGAPPRPPTPPTPPPGGGALADLAARTGQDEATCRFFLECGGGDVEQAISVMRQNGRL